MEDYKKLLEDFYSKYNPEKISEVQGLLAKYKGQEEELLIKLHDKYKVKNYYKLFKDLYSKYNPEKISEIPDLLKKYEGQEEELLSNLYKKYKVNQEEFVEEKSIIRSQIVDNNATAKNEVTKTPKNKAKLFVIGGIIALVAIAVIVTAIFIFGNSSMEKDAKKLAGLTWKVEQLAKKVDSGDNSALPEVNRLSEELKILLTEMQKKYSKDGSGPKFAAIYEKTYAEICKNPELIDSEIETDSGTSEETEDADSESESTSNEFTNQTREILKTHNFTKITSLTSIIAINFDDTHFTFRVLATNGTELSRANGTYQILPGLDGAIAKIGLIQEGSIQKSPLYADSNGIDTELFLHFNKELLLTKPTEKSLSYFNALELMTMEENMPEYFLLGRDAFSSSRLNTQAEKDSIANEELIMDEKKKDLEEKLKGF